MNILSIFKKKTKRTLPLKHVHTFATGEKLYTYNPEDYGKVSSRHYRSIQEATNYIQTFALTKNEWDSAVSGCKQIIEDALVAKDPQKTVSALLDINSTFDWFLSKVNGLKNTNEVILEYLFCMFYVLEDETETGYSEIHNKKKIELLNIDQNDRDFFLSSLKGIMNNLYPISKDDSLTLLLQMEQMKGALTYLNMQGI